MKPRLGLLLIGMFLIVSSLIFISATTLKCCTETKVNPDGSGGAICQNLDSTDSSSCAVSLLPTKCEDTTNCKIGCCFDSEQGVCSARSTKQECELGGGEWDDEDSCLIQKCEKGCCELGPNTQFVTDTRCSLLSLQEGFAKVFDKSISESVCRFFSEEEGACVLSDGTCTHEVEEACVTILGGEFYNSYCSDEGLKVYGVDCTAKDSVKCTGEENLYDVYNFDSCGNKEDIAEECNYPEGKCVEGICKDLSCIDEKGNSKKNGESWCVYDSYVGELKLSLNIEEEGVIHPVCTTYLDNDCSLYPIQNFQTLFKNYDGQIICKGKEAYACEENNEDDTNRWVRKTSKDSECGMYNANCGCFVDEAKPVIQSPVCINYLRESCSIRNEIICKGNKAYNCEYGPIDYYDEDYEFPLIWIRNISQDSSCNQYNANCGDSTEPVKTPVCTTYLDNNCNSNYDDYEGQIICKGNQAYNCTYDLIYDEGGYIDSLTWVRENSKDSECSKYNLNCRDSAEEKCKDPAKSFISTFSSDVAGSEHTRRMCVEGEIKPEVCGDYRNQICAEQIIEGTSISKCRVNEGFKCLSISDPTECEVVPDCRVHNVNVDTNFKFDVCVPKYPLGFDFNSAEDEENGKTVCGLASQTCTVTYSDGGLFGGGGCEGNCNCETQTFTNEMNEFCISLGDCGNYINVEGANSKGEKNNEYTEYLTKENTEENTPQYIFSGLEDGSYSDELNKFNIAGNFDYEGIHDDPAIRVLGNSIVSNFGPEFHVADLFGIDFGIREAVVGFLFGKAETKSVTFKCIPWKPPIGGEDCEKCQEDDLKPCTEYRCSSLGGSCDLINTDFENPLCINRYPNDVNPPVISLGEVLTEGYGFKNEEPKQVEIRADDNGCIQEFTKINFSLNTDEYSICKFNYERTNWIDYEDTGEYSKELTEYTKNHTFEIRLPYLSSPNVNSNELNMYIRCQDPAGSLNIEEYIVNFCLRPGPDLLEPNIIRTIPSDGSFLKYGITKSNLMIYLDEPAECKYDVIENKQYVDMLNEFLICDSAEEIKLEYSCFTNLTGLTEIKNKIYIKCNDTSGNINVEDFVYTLQATENELKIDSITPQGTLTSGFEPISVELEVKTSKGVENGKSKCFWEWGGSWIGFLNTLLTTHTQPGINLMRGEFNISIKCEDIAGNVANGNAVFNINVDSEPPVAVRVFYKGGNLKLITNEDAKCYYNFTSCDFNLEDGTSMTSLFSIEHSANWIVGKTYYIKCKDRWDNENPTCAIKAEPSN